MADVRYPNDGEMTNIRGTARSPFAPTSTFRSCPAATGEARGGASCPHFPDTAHRCGEGRDHVIYQTDVHTCTCGFAWYSATVVRSSR